MSTNWCIHRHTQSATVGQQMSEEADAIGSTASSKISSGISTAYQGTCRSADTQYVTLLFIFYLRQLRPWPPRRNFGFRTSDLRASDVEFEGTWERREADISCMSLITVMGPHDSSLGVESYLISLSGSQKKLS